MKALTNAYQKISLLLNQTTSTTYFVAALKQKYYVFLVLWKYPELLWVSGRGNLGLKLCIYKH